MRTESHIKTQLIKFNLYGLFKNLKFFDPYLWVYLINNGLDFTKIGILIAIREVIIYFFEIPSGVFADEFGRKTELVICFIFYIASFVLFYIGGEYYMFIFAFILFGFGEAFRSGTHKSMIMEFVEVNELKDSKTKIYGLTRSYSMIGSAISSIVSIVIVLFLPELSILFLVSIIPYIFDLLLILSYPSYLNQKNNNKTTFKDFVKGITVIIMYTLKDVKMRKLLIDSSSYNAIFKTVKDYLQPILLFLMYGIIILDKYSEEQNVLVLIGLSYAGIYLISAMASRFSYKILLFGHRDIILKVIWAFTSVLFLILGIMNKNEFVVISLFIMIYVLQNLRKPIIVEKIADHTENNKRASILSVESQLTSLIVVILAPILGLIYDNFGVMYIFYLLSAINLLYVIFKKKGIV